MRRNTVSDVLAELGTEPSSTYFIVRVARVDTPREADAGGPGNRLDFQKSDGRSIVHPGATNSPRVMPETACASSSWDWWPGAESNHRHADFQ
jgi:hypothetical protein